MAVVKTSATTDRTLVMRLGQRFESARRLSQFGLSKRNTRNEKGSHFDIQKPFDTTHKFFWWKDLQSTTIGYISQRERRSSPEVSVISSKSKLALIAARGQPPPSLFRAQLL